jgi:hypothetical protein
MARALPNQLVTVPVLLGWLALACGCVQHRTAVNPPLPASPPPAGESPVITQLIVGAKVIDEPKQPVTHSSPLPLDLPVSVWRRDSDGTLHRGELRVTTALPWWQRFPADAVTDLAPYDAEVFASGTAAFTPVPTADRAQLFAEAERDGYAHHGDPVKKPVKHDDAKDAKARPSP